MLEAKNGDGGGGGGGFVTPKEVLNNYNDQKS